MTILTRADGTPFERPEKPAPDADIETKIAYIRAEAAYREAVSDYANKAFAEELRKNLR